MPSGADGSRRDLTALALAAFALALIGGRPFFHPDSIVPRALTALAHGGNPGHFDYPALIADLDALAIGLVFAALRLGGRVPTWEAYAASAAPGAPWPAPGPVAGVVTALFSALGAVCVYAIARRLTARRLGGWLAAAFLLLAPLWNAHAHDPTVDVPLAALGAAAVLAVLRALDDPPLAPGRAALPGALLGLATAAKYSGALVAASVLAPLVAAARGRGARGRVAAVTLGAAALAFLVANPYVVPRFHRYFVSAATQLGWLGAGADHLGFQTAGPSWRHHLTVTLPQGFGAAPLALALLGFGAALARRPRDRPTWLALGAYPLLALILPGVSRLAFQRYLLPVLPFLALAAAAGVLVARDGLAALARRAGVSPRAATPLALTLALALATSALLPGLAPVARHDQVLARADTRSALVAALREAVGTRPLRVLATGYTREVLERSAALPAARFTADWPGDVAADSTDLYLFDSFEHDRLLYDPAGPAQGTAARNYEGLAVVALTPFTRPRAEVPFAPESGATPAPPDLAWRRRPGPYLEIAARDPRLADAIAATCRRLGFACERVSGREAYYFPRLGKPAPAAARPYSS